MAETWYQDGEGNQALRVNRERARLAGYGVGSGGGHDANAASGLTITFTETTGFFAGTEATAAGQNVSFTQEVTDTPRKVLVCLTEAGELVKRAGEPEDYDPPLGEIDADTSILRGTNRPAPPDLAGEPGTIPIAEVLLEAGTTELGDEDVADRRVRADVRVREVVAAVIKAGRIIDGAGVGHTDELADLADVRTNDDIETVINDDPVHGSRDSGVGAQHEFWTAIDTLETINGQEELTVNITGDARTLRGDPPTAFADRVHDHDPDYLNDAPGTVTPENLDRDYVSEDEFGTRQDSAIGSGSATLTGGQNPAATITATVEAPIDADLDVDYSTDGSGGFDPGFAFGHTESGWEQRWDPSANNGSGGYTIELTVSWTTDPGGGNNVPVTYDVIHENEVDF